MNVRHIYRDYRGSKCSITVQPETFNIIEVSPDMSNVFRKFNENAIDFIDNTIAFQKKVKEFGLEWKEAKPA